MDNYIKHCNQNINQNISNGLLLDDRGFMSQNILGQLRNLVDHVCVKIYVANGGVIGESEYDNIRKAKAYVKGVGQLHFLYRFHEFLLISASHYTFDSDSSERLMLKYYEYLMRIKAYMKDHFNMELLENLSLFPVDTDPALRKYHEAIARRIDTMDLSVVSTQENRFYIEKTKPFFVGGRVYYEVTFVPANDKASKFDRIIAFTDKELPAFYAIYLRTVSTSVEVDGMVMPVNVVVDSRLAIRMCELRNFSKIFGSPIPKTQGMEYTNLMRLLHETHMSLTEVIDLPDEDYGLFMSAVRSGAKSHYISGLLDRTRRHILDDADGVNVLRYLLLRLNNRLIKRQLYSMSRNILGGLYLKPQCKPFDRLPFAFSLVDHNPRMADLLDSIPVDGHEAELLYRRIRQNTEQCGCLYTPVGDLAMSGDTAAVAALADRFNASLHPKHQDCSIDIANGHCFIRGYEKDVCSVISRLKDEAKAGGVVNYSKLVDAWLDSPQADLRAHSKAVDLKSIFAGSNLALIYGAAGTGKSTFINFISRIFSENTKLYLANTVPAVDNLRRKVDAPNSYFSTIAGFLANPGAWGHYDILVVDECSTVSNRDMRAVLEEAAYSLLVLVGDTYQIEAIQFGNWFNVAYHAFKSPVKMELQNVYRTTETGLLNLWQYVRDIKPEITEFLAKGEFSYRLDGSIFKPSDDDEIILALNYDGLYGINNINRFLQNNNPNPPVSWGIHTYKVGDPVLFNETQRFTPWLYNNLKGRILGIDTDADYIYFTVEVNTVLSGVGLANSGLELVESADPKTSIVRFRVGHSVDNDDDLDSDDCIVPFQIAYAVSIHKAQGLEYKSVKVVITREVEEQITHNILYTAITRACEKLKIYWSPETQQKIIDSLHSQFNHKDYSLLGMRHPELLA